MYFLLSSDSLRIVQKEHIIHFLKGDMYTMLGLFTKGAKPIKERDRNEYIVAHLLNTANLSRNSANQPRHGRRALLELRDQWANERGERIDLAVEGLTVRNVAELLKSTGATEFESLDVVNNEEHNKKVRGLFKQSLDAYTKIADTGVYPHSILDPELRAHFPELMTMNRLTFELPDKSARSLNVGQKLAFNYTSGGETMAFEQEALEVDWSERKRRADAIISANQPAQQQATQQRNAPRNQTSNQQSRGESTISTDRFMGWDGKQVGEVFYPGVSSAIGAYLTDSDARIVKQNISDDAVFGADVVEGSVELFKYMRSQGYEFNAVQKPFAENTIEVEMQSPTRPKIRMLDNARNGIYMGRVYDRHATMYFVDIPNSRPRQFSIDDSIALVDYAMGRKKGAVKKAKNVDSSIVELEGVARSRKLQVNPVSERYAPQIFNSSESAETYLRGTIDSAQEYVEDVYKLDEIASLAQVQIDNADSTGAIDFKSEEFREGIDRLLNRDPSIRDSQQAVIQHIVESQSVDMEALEGIRNDLIGSYEDGFDPVLTKAFMDLTGRGNERDAMIAALKASKYDDAKLKGNAFGVGSYKERMLSFDPDTAKGIREVSDPTSRLALRTVMDTLENGDFTGPNGEASPEVLIDEMGVIKWSARRPLGGKNSEPQVVSGEIGQVLSPDEHGIIKTKFNSGNNYDFVPGYTGYFSFEGDFEDRASRLRVKGFEQHLTEQLQVTVNHQMTRPYSKELGDIPTALDATIMNRMYQSDMYGVRIDKDFMETSLLPEEDKVRNIETEKRRVRFDNVYSDHATTGAETQYNLERERALLSGEQGDISSLRGSESSYSYYKAAGSKNMRVIYEDFENIMDMDMTGTGKNQGISLYLVEGANVNLDGTITPSKGMPVRDITDNRDVLKDSLAELHDSLKVVDGKSTVDEDLQHALYTQAYEAMNAKGISVSLEDLPRGAALYDAVAVSRNGSDETYDEFVKYMDDYGVKVNGIKYELDRAPVLKSESFKNANKSAWDRVQMSANQVMDTERIDRNVNTALIPMGGWHNNDGFVISKEFADRNKLFGASPNHESMTDLSKMIASITNDANPETGIADDPDINAKIDAHMDELGVKWSKEVVMQGISLYADKYGYGNDHLADKQLLIDRDDLEANESWQKEWGEFLNENGRFRPLVRGDKLSDYGGNKGVIGLVVDRNMSDKEAKKQDLVAEVAIMKANPELDLVASPYSMIGRHNGSVIHDLMDGIPKDVIVPDDVPNPITGQKYEAAMGKLDILVTNMLVDEKTKAYSAQDVREGKGRKASGQLAWALQSKGAETILSTIYGENDKEWETLREYLIVTGLDMKPDGTIVKGYEAHHGEDRNEFDYNPKESPAEFLNKIKDQGGFLNLPFEVSFKTGEKTTAMPIMSASLRDDVALVDGTMRVDNYTSDYMRIYEAVGEYHKLHDKVESGKVSKEQKKQYDKAVSDIHGKFNAIQSTVIDREINGSHNGKNSFIRDRVMSRRMEKSATGVAIPDPRLGIGDAGMNSEMMSALGVEEGDTVMMFRDPVWRDGAIRAVTVIHDETANGVSYNPIASKSHDGDFDGDTMGLINLDNPEATEELKRLFSHEANMIDLGNGENELYFQDDMDLVSAAHDAFELTGDESYLNMRGDIERLANEGKSEEAFEQLNGYTRTMFREFGFGSDYVNLKNDATVEASFRKMNERGAKGGPTAVDEYMEYHNGNMTLDDARDVQYATGVKSDDTGLAGSFSQKFVAIMRNSDIQSALEAMYPVTQGTLQIKKDAKKARRVNKILTEDLRTTLNGRDLHNPKEKLSPQQFKKQLAHVFRDKEEGFGVKVNDDFIDGITDALTVEGEIVPISKAFEAKGSPMDRVAYGGGFTELCKIADKKESLLEGKYNNLFAPNSMRQSDETTVIAKRDTQKVVAPEPVEEPVHEEVNNEPVTTEPELNEELLDNLEKVLSPNHSNEPVADETERQAQQEEQLAFDI